MKLISLNTWGGRVHEPLLHFIQNHNDADIFCFQELYLKAEGTHIQAEPKPALDIYFEIEQCLPDHKGYFRPHLGTHYGIGIFVKKNIEVLEEGEIMIYENPNYSGKGGDHSRNLQFIMIKQGNEVLTILNVHGMWVPDGKMDTPARIEQSERIKRFMNNVSGKCVLIGDFNLNPDTDSLKIIGEGKRNLILENKITNTRSKLYRMYDSASLYADYAFVSPEMEVKHFEVLQDVVSDHLPLLLEIE